MAKRFGKNDLIFLIAIIIVCGLAIIFFYASHSEKGNELVITVNGEYFGSYSLDIDETIEIKNDSGEITNYLEIKDGHANMLSASCPDGLCVKQKTISLNKETIVCLPNKVVITVLSDEEAEVDAVAN